MSAEILFGLVGVTFVISMGSIFEGVREWLMSFEHRYNVFRLIGELVSCPMCSGMWVGMLWAWHAGHDWMGVLVGGGLVSLLVQIVMLIMSATDKAVELIPEPHRRADVLRRMLEARGVSIPGVSGDSDDEDEDE